jgi:hypothetical protein
MSFHSLHICMHAAAKHTQGSGLYAQKTHGSASHTPTSKSHTHSHTHHLDINQSHPTPAHADTSQPPKAAVEEDANPVRARKPWVHYSLVHTNNQGEGAAVSMYRDGVLVTSASNVPYEWLGGDELQCHVGSSDDDSTTANIGGRFSGDVMQFYYWDSALSGKELARTRSVGTPQHTSSNTSVYGVTGSECADVNECALGTHSCAASDVCSNTFGSFFCADVSMSAAGDVLDDNNECTSRNNSCALLRAGPTSCINTLGSYSCACGNGTTNVVNLSRTEPLVTLPNNTRLGSGGLTISLWVHVKDMQDQPQVLIECSRPHLTHAFMFLLAFSSGTNRFHYVLEEAGSAISNPRVAYAAAWTHFSLVHSSRHTVAMYQDGAQVAESSLTYPFGDSDTVQCTFGGAVAAANEAGRLVGRLQAVYIWARALNASEVSVSFSVVMHTRSLSRRQTL